jgi:hypothetical protein
MLELRRNSDQNPLSKVGQGAKQYVEDLSRDFSIMLFSERPEPVVAVEGIEITAPAKCICSAGEAERPVVCCRPNRS